MSMLLSPEIFLDLLHQPADIWPGKSRGVDLNIKIRLHKLNRTYRLVGWVTLPHRGGGGGGSVLFRQGSAR
jgi:hypothetical protein